MTSAHRTHLAVLASVAVVRNHGSDATSRSATRSTDHQHQLHQVVVHVGRARGLNDEQVLTTDILVDIDHNLTIGKATNLSISHLLLHHSARAQLRAKLLHNLFSQRAVCIATEHSQVALDRLYTSERSAEEDTVLDGSRLGRLRRHNPNTKAHTVSA